MATSCASPRAPKGRTKVVNRAAETAHVLMLSTRREPAVAVYPDSDKVGVFTEDPGARVMVRRASTVDYWDGERLGGGGGGGGGAVRRVFFL